jgi:hypothetical protein
MVLAFLSLALSCLTSFIAIRSQIGTTGGKIGLIGWPNRLLVAAYSGWLMAVAWHAAQLSRQGSWAGVPQGLVAAKP